MLIVKFDTVSTVTQKDEKYIVQEFHKYLIAALLKLRFADTNVCFLSTFNVNHCFGEFYLMMVHQMVTLMNSFNSVKHLSFSR